MQFRPSRKRAATFGIDMSPMLDCVFQLLIFFLLSSTFLVPATRLTLPKAATGKIPHHQRLIITANAAGKLFLGHQAVDWNTLQPALRKQLAALPRARREVVFRGDAKLPYQTFMRVMDIARRAGAAHFQLAHQAPTEPAK